MVRGFGAQAVRAECGPGYPARAVPTLHGPRRVGTRPWHRLDDLRLSQLSRTTRSGVERWLSDPPDGDWAAGRLPSSVLVAGRALRTAKYPEEAGEVAISRVLSRSDDWGLLHGTSLVFSSSRQLAVIVEPAHPARITPLLMSADGLSEREQEVTRLVLQGNSTTDIAETLFVSAHTVQQHLKSVFDKTGIRSRRDLVGRVFFAHYEPTRCGTTSVAPLSANRCPVDHSTAALPPAPPGGPYTHARD